MPSEGFDLRTDIRDPKTGSVIRRQPYRRHVMKGHPVFYERDGVLFYENGETVPDDKMPAIQLKPHVVEKTAEDRIRELENLLARRDAENRKLKSEREALESLATQPVEMEAEHEQVGPSAVVSHRVRDARESGGVEPAEFAAVTPASG